MRFVDEMKLDEIAAALNIPLGHREITASQCIKDIENGRENAGLFRKEYTAHG